MQIFDLLILGFVADTNHQTLTGLVIGFTEVNALFTFFRDRHTAHHDVNVVGHQRGNQAVKPHVDEFHLNVHALADFADHIHIETDVFTTGAVEELKGSKGRMRTDAKRIGSARGKGS